VQEAVVTVPAPRSLPKPSTSSRGARRGVAQHAGWSSSPVVEGLGPAGDYVLAPAIGPVPLREATHDLLGCRRFASELAAVLAFIVCRTHVPLRALGSGFPNMPWGSRPLQQILQSIEGPVSKIVAVIIIIVTGLTLAFGDTSGGFSGA